ncbi:MAG: hypothetical protein WAV41_00215 [Microgenomates group bacterium]
MASQLDTTPRLIQNYYYEPKLRPPEAFLDHRYQRLVEILHKSLPDPQMIMIGFWPTYDTRLLDPDTVAQMGQSRQNLDIDMFLPVARTDDEYWTRIYQEGYSPVEYAAAPNRDRKIIPVGGNPNIIFFDGFTFLSPKLSQLSEDELKPIISQAFFDHLPKEHRYQKTGRTGDQLTVIGEDVSMWGANRRAQPEGEGRPYLEIMPLVVDGPYEEYLDRTLERYGYSSDLSPLYCQVYEGQYTPLDLHIRKPEYYSFGMSGLPELNYEYIKVSPANALNWIRRGVKTIALYSQLANTTGNLGELVIPQLELLYQHIDAIASTQPDIYDSVELVDKINSSFAVVATVLKQRLGIEVPPVLLAKSEHT